MADPHTTGSRRPDKPLSEAPEYTAPLGGGEMARFDEQGRVLCYAKRRDGKLCKSPAVTGMKVCRMHGASSPQSKNKVKLRLAELVDPAIATLAREMMNADKSSDKQRAANSILDRAGVVRQQKIEVEDAREILAQRIIELRERREEEAE